MADTKIDILDSSSATKEIDTRTESTNGQHRQVIVVGDPSSNSGVAPVSGTNGLAVDPKTLPPDAATATNQATIIGHVDGIEGLLTTIDVDTGNIATSVSGLLTDTQLRATPVPVSGTVTANLGTLNGAATAANQTTIIGHVDGIEGLLTTIDADTGSIASDTASLVAKDFATQTTLAALNTKVPSNLTVSSTRLLVDGSGVTQPVSGTITEIGRAHV